MNSLLDRWLTALRASTAFAVGRECDYARAEGDADTFDPIGLLSLAAGYDAHSAVWYATTGMAIAPPFVAPGAWLSRQVAESLAQEVGLDPALLPTLCELADDNWSGDDIANWVTRNTHG